MKEQELKSLFDRYHKTKKSTGKLKGLTDHDHPHGGRLDQVPLSSLALSIGTSVQKFDQLFVDASSSLCFNEQRIATIAEDVKAGDMLMMGPNGTLIKAG